eukprot:CAMPEP_0116127790 /NCGR_PEP_ID=MMETSP0329-20121206/7020_1 /TAXON_ID=697910 /ORGANISM="Pseudo-nitzschia arenysensis, Strain B593" /LENGTH=718 /DNA_ID=CAMNT_0003621897 /DNA_START=145 /DNA_END=2301 /DNA_ORIENTATION=-
MAWNLSYRLFGPTTVHLKHEIYLLISLTLLLHASVRDLRFTALVTIWLSRCLVLRWMLTTRDKLTSLSERSIPFLEKYNRYQFSLFENAIDFISTVVLAGQTFDRPDAHVVAKTVGTNHTAADMMVENDLGSVLHGGGSSSRGNHHHRRGAAGHHHTGGNGFFEWCEITFYKLQDLFPTSLSMIFSEPYWANVARAFGPSPQLLFQLTTVCFLCLCWIYPLSEENGGFVRYFSTMYRDVAQVLRDIYNIAANRDVIYYHYGRHDTTSGPLVSNHALIMEALPESGPAMGYSGEITIDNTKVYGMYQHTFDPTWIDLSYYVILCGTILALVLYGRVLFPIPDLVAGSNALSDSAVASGGGGSGSKGSRGNNHSQQRGGGSASAASAGGGDALFDRPWLEQYQSIITEQRLKLIVKVGFARMVENLVLIAFLPRTDLACTTTGQCPNKSGLRELAKVMFYAGITSPLRSDTESYQLEDGKRPFSVGENPYKPDLFCAVLIGISVVVVTLSLLLAQATTLNRSHLGINGYLAGGWVVANTESDASNDGSNSSTQTHNKSHGKSPRVTGGHKKSSDSFLRQPPDWVPRKRYKKGDIVSYEGGLYKATTNNPEGKPYHFFLWLTHKIFRNELGHPATSRVIAFVSTVQFGLVSALIITILSAQLFSPRSFASTSYDGASSLTTSTIDCLLWILAANLVAVYGTVSVAIPDYSELGALAGEITR